MPRSSAADTDAAAPLGSSAAATPPPPPARAGEGASGPSIELRLAPAGWGFAAGRSPRLASSIDGGGGGRRRSEGDCWASLAVESVIC